MLQYAIGGGSMNQAINKEYYLKKAQENLPKLFSDDISILNEFKQLNSGDSFVIDLGNHYVGYFSFVLGYTDIYPDAPVRLRVRFCESKDEIDSDFTTYHGSLCPSWLQEEIINVDFVGEYKMTRRYAARYIKIDVLFTRRTITLSNFVFSAVTSADKSRLTPINIDDTELENIDTVSVNTLKNCMQRIFEDGPKRDRRLWIGDLRLEALTNYYTYGQCDVVRRCLYLFAAADCDSDGFLPGFLYENPIFVSGSWFLRDYALLFVVSLCDYYLYTGDEKTFLDIYPVAKKQMDAILNAVDDNGIVVVKDKNNIFIDWNPALKKTTSMHGVYLYTLKILCKALGEMKHHDAQMFERRYQDAKQAAICHLYNSTENNFANEYDNYQISVHSAVWMILGEVVEGDNAWEILQAAMSDKEGPKPVTPYMNHYLVEAMMKLERNKEAMDHIKFLWGMMVKEGADTFYEIFVPGKSDFSPYGDSLINSRCHAWSCTPSYFIRKMLKGK